MKTFTHTFTQIQTFAYTFTSIKIFTHTLICMQKTYISTCIKHLHTIQRLIHKFKHLDTCKHLHMHLCTHLHRLFDIYKHLHTYTKQLHRLLNDPIYPTPPLGQDMTHGQFLSGV